MSRSSDLDILNSPPLSLSGLSDLSTSSSLANWMPVGDGDTSGSEQDMQPPMTLRNRVLDELPSRRPGDKCLSAEVRLVRTVTMSRTLVLPERTCPYEVSGRVGKFRWVF